MLFFDLGCDDSIGCLVSTEYCPDIPNECAGNVALQNSQCSGGSCGFVDSIDCGESFCDGNVAKNEGDCTGGYCIYDEYDCTDDGGCVVNSEGEAVCACPGGTSDIQMRNGSMRSICITDCMAAAPMCQLVPTPGTGNWIPDGMCDIYCNVAECGYDGGDCCVDTCGEPGQPASQAKRYHWCDGRNEGGRDSASQYVYNCIDPEAEDRLGAYIDGVNSRNYTFTATENNTPYARHTTDDAA